MDDRELAWGLIGDWLLSKIVGSVFVENHTGRQSCLDPDDTVEEHMNKNQVKKFPIKSSILISGWLGQRYFQSNNIFTFQAGWGYRKENCRIGKIDVAASMLQSCSFLKPNTTSRCTPSKSAALASVLKSGGTELNRDLREKYKEECLSNCQFLR